MKIVSYTFRTNTYAKNLGLKNIFVFGKLKRDVRSFQKILLKENPEYILGIAIIKKGFSRFESVAVNQFHGKKIHRALGKEKYALFVPERNRPFRVSKIPSQSFCNWTMYVIAEFLEQAKLPVKYMFVHLHPKDIDIFNEFLKIII